jgi:hypothetical protein
VIIILMIRNAHAQSVKTDNLFKLLSDKYKITLISDDYPVSSGNNSDNISIENLSDFFDCEVIRNEKNVVLLRNKFSSRMNVPKISFLEIKTRLSLLQKSSKRLVPQNTDPALFAKMPGVIVKKLKHIAKDNDIKNGIPVSQLNTDIISDVNILCTERFLSNQLMINRILRQIESIKNESSFLKLVKPHTSSPEILVLEGLFGNSDFKFQYGVSHSFIISGGVSYVNIKGDIFATSAFETNPPLDSSVFEKLSNLVNTPNRTIKVIENKTTTLGSYCKTFTESYTDFPIQADESIRNRKLLIVGERYSRPKEILSSISTLFNLEIAIQSNGIRILRPKRPPIPLTISEVNHNIFNYIPGPFASLNRQRIDVNNLDSIYHDYLALLDNQLKGKVSIKSPLKISETDPEIVNILSSLFLISAIHQININRIMPKYPDWLQETGSLILKIEGDFLPGSRIELILKNNKTGDVAFRKSGIFR